VAYGIDEAADCLRVLDMPPTGGMALVSGLAGEHPERKIGAAASWPLSARRQYHGQWRAAVASSKQKITSAAACCRRFKGFGQPAPAIAAWRCGCFDEGHAQFTFGRFSQTLEYRRDKFPEQPVAGPFFVVMGGFLMSLLLGFPGIAPDAGDVDH
jgi:hypothetical protein